jgi:hypothetical protein
VPEEVLFRIMLRSHLNSRLFEKSVPCVIVILLAPVFSKAGVLLRTKYTKYIVPTIKNGMKHENRNFFNYDCGDAQFSIE